MKQYCRYCVHLHTPNGIWCDAKGKELSENTAKSVNNCKQFVFCEEDAFFETDGYKPRTSGHREPAVDEIGENQMSIFGGENNG